MGDSRSAIYDDECEWADFCRKYSLKDVKWDMYSREADIAKEFARRQKGTVTGQEIKLYVKYTMSCDTMIKEHNLAMDALHQKYKDQVQLLKELNEV